MSARRLFPFLSFSRPDRPRQMQVWTMATPFPWWISASHGQRLGVVGSLSPLSLPGASYSPLEDPPGLATRRLSAWILRSQSIKGRAEAKRGEVVSLILTGRQLDHPSWVWRRDWVLRWGSWTARKS